MNKLIKFFSIVVLSVGLLGGCASQVYHDYIMSGQVVTVDDKQAVVCVSDTDGLKEHQVFNVYRNLSENKERWLNERIMKADIEKEFLGLNKWGQKNIKTCSYYYYSKKHEQYYPKVK